jgi:alkaline phosphatase
MHISRRRLLAVVAAAGVAGGGALAAATPVTAEESERAGRAKNVIYLVGDGMGYTHVTAGRQRFFGADGRMVMETLPVDGHVSTYAVEPNSAKPDLVTDSASSATAWASGVKTYNAAIGVDARGRIVPTIMEQAKRAGLSTGNVSTAEITDATPAAQMAHTLLRGCQGPDGGRTASACNADSIGVQSTNPLVYTPIAEQIARNNVADVIFGGGLSRFEAEDQRVMRRNGYQVLGSFGQPDPTDPSNNVPGTQRVATKQELSRADGRKVIGLFNSGNLTVEAAKQDLRAAGRGAEAPAQEPTLAQMTRKAITLLDRDGRNNAGFYLQVEGAQIDKRSHANDADQTLEEQKAFDDAVRVARNFAEREGNTLVVVTADHECAGFNIIATGSFTNAEAANPPNNIDSGNPANNSTPSRTSAANTKDPTRSTGPVNGAGGTDPHNFAPATFGTPDDGADYRSLDGTEDASLWLSYLSGNHTGADVPVFAYGPRSGLFNGAQDNTDHYDYVRGALRL